MAILSKPYIELLNAIRYSSVDRIKEILKSVNLGQYNGYAIRLAAREGLVNVVQLLLDHGAETGLELAMAIANDRSFKQTNKDKAANFKAIEQLLSKHVDQKKDYDELDVIGTHTKIELYLHHIRKGEYMELHDKVHSSSDVPLTAYGGILIDMAIAHGQWEILRMFLGLMVNESSLEMSNHLDKLLDGMIEDDDFWFCEAYWKLYGSRFALEAFFEIAKRSNLLKVPLENVSLKLLRDSQ